MTRKYAAMAAALALGSASAVSAQVEVKQPNDNVTKVDGMIGPIQGKALSNPAQTHVHAQVPGEAKVQVHVKDEPTTELPDPGDINLEVKQLNDNVTKIEGSAGDLSIKGISTPGTTNVKVQDPGQVKVQVQTKPVSE